MGGCSTRQLSIVKTLHTTLDSLHATCEASVFLKMLHLIVPGLSRLQRSQALSATCGSKNSPLLKHLPNRDLPGTPIEAILGGGLALALTARAALQLA